MANQDVQKSKEKCLPSAAPSYSKCPSNQVKEPSHEAKSIPNAVAAPQYAAKSPSNSSRSAQKSTNSSFKSVQSQPSVPNKSQHAAKHPHTPTINSIPSCSKSQSYKKPIPNEKTHDILPLRSLHPATSPGVSKCHLKSVKPLLCAASPSDSKDEDTSLASMSSLQFFSGSHSTGSSHEYAAKNKDFGDRIMEDLFLEDLQYELSRENYKERFHKLLCWEEKEHIDILGKRCNGKYKIHYHNMKPGSIDYSDVPCYSCYCSIEGMSGDQIAYVTQSSELAVIFACAYEEIEAYILPENHNHTDDYLYLGLDVPNAKRFMMFMPQTGTMYLDVQFEVKHSYFNNLHDAIESLSSEIIARLIPTAVNVEPLYVMPFISRSCYEVLHLDSDSPGPQTDTVGLMASCPNSNPPFLITGSFGTGKTRLLAAATHHFLQQGHFNRQLVRVLVCAHHQASAEAFIDNYFNVVKYETGYPWQDIVVRIASQHGNIKNAKYRSVYDTATNFCSNASRCANIVVVTTFLTSLQFRDAIPVGFFTHILLDEASQSREPEAIAPLCLASTDTKIVMAGDKMQVGPALLVLGREAQQYGLQISLLERLWNLYYMLDSVTLSLQCVELNVNYRAHREIMNLASKLFYNCSLSSMVSDSISHPDAPYPLLFVCSSLDDTIKQVQRDTDENEARLILNQVLKFIDRWPTKQWGPKNLRSICIITPTRHQVSVIKAIIFKEQHYSRLKGVTLLPTYDIQGREFQALFLGTIEPTDYDGMTCNPTKSICDPFVFNTAITRARSLVVCIGNPFTLLRMERNSSKSCWKEYLHLCSMNNTLIIKECTNNHVEIQKLQTLIEGKTLPSTAIKMVSYPNERNASKCQKTELDCRTIKEERISRVASCNNGAKKSVPARYVGSHVAYSKSDYYIENRTRCLDLIKQELTVATYKIKFHELLAFEEEEHKSILKARCDGTYQLVLLDGIPENLPCDRHDYVLYGYICNKNGNEWDGDNFSYATQATEDRNSVLISIMEHEMNADIISLKNVQLDCYLCIGFNNYNSEKIKTCVTVGAAPIKNVNVTFNLKHSYFSRMHKALDALSSQVIETLFPKPKAFRDIKHFWNPDCDFMDIQLDTYGQQQALSVILGCHSKAIVLITGPFGTGKTLLLAHAVYHVLKQEPNARILICAHHQKSANAFIEKYFGPMKKGGWKPNLIRLSKRKPYNSQFETYWKQQDTIMNNESELQVVVSTFGESLSLLNIVKQGFFTHIFIDEAAQTREPETIIPLCLASSNTRIIIAGDHYQVGPGLLVLGSEAQEYGLKYSLLQRLHQQYKKIGKCAVSHCAVLLHNYRCHSSLLRLPSSLFYNSTLQSMVPDNAHPEAPYPLLFVCSSINASAECTSGDSDVTEAELLLNQVSKFVNAWPEREWMEHKLETICVMTTSSNQKTLIWSLINKKYKSLKRISVLTSYEMQGTEYRALFISTHEKTLSDGRASNPTKSMCDPYVFNTALTRAQSLVVAVGNPFLLLKTENHMEHKYEFKVKCWQEYLKRCIEYKTLIVPQPGGDWNHLDAVIQLQSILFKNAAHLSSIVPLTHDSILDAYAKVFHNNPQCRQAQIMISHINGNLTWTLSKESSNSEGIDKTPSPTFCKQYECILSCSRFDKADAMPCDPNNHTVKILGANNRRGAFDGDRVLVGIFDDTDPQRKGRVLKCTQRSSTSLAFACHVDTINPILFVPLNNKDPKILNLPKLSQDLLTIKSKLELEEGFRATEVIVFEDAWNGQGLPKICDAIPFTVARKMVFVVRILCWNPKYRLPLGIVVASIPQGISFFHAQRLLKVEYNVSDLQTTSLIPCDSTLINPLLPLNERAFTIDPENAQNLDDAISLILIETNEQSRIYEMAVHIVNVAKYIKKDSDEDKKAMEASLSVYGTRDSGCAHLLSAEIRSRLTLSPGKMRDVISVVCTVTIGDNTTKPQISKPEIKESQIVSQLQLTYQSANDILNGAIPAGLSHEIEFYNSNQPSQPSLTSCLNILYQIAMEQRKTRLGQIAAFSYKISEDGDETCWQSHLLVEELMIWANHAVAEHTYSSYPNCALLLRQSGPNNEEKFACLEHHKLILSNSLFLQAMISKPVTAHPITIPNFLIHKLIDALNNNDAPLITYLLTADHYYPQLAVCQAQLQRINHRAEYCCTSDIKDAEAMSHYSLQLNLYTHSTSPIRRYMDICVQRLVIGSLLAGREDDFPVETFQGLCSHLNSRSKAARSFENGLKQVSLGLKLTAQSVECYAFVKQCDKSAVDLYFPDLMFKVLSPTQRNIKFRWLGVVEKNPNKKFLYAWKIKILSFEGTISLWGYQNPVANEPISDDNASAVYKIETLDLTTNSNFKKVHNYAKPIPDFVSVDAETWKRLQCEACKTATVTAGSPHQSLKLLEDTKRLLNVCIKDVSAQQEPFITSSPLVNLEIFCNISMYDLLKVWMSWEAKDQPIAPCIQMINVAPNAHICIQHNSSPAECFSEATLPQASKAHYNSISEYVGLWEQLILAEGAEISVKQSQIIIVQNATLKWPNLVIPDHCVDDLHYIPQGCITASIPHDLQKTSASFVDSIRIGDMVCVRYGTTPASNKVKAVFHMVVTKLVTVKDVHEALLCIEMKIFGKQNSRISKEVRESLHLKCELQLIPMAVSIQRVFSTLSKLRGHDRLRPISNITKCIVLGNISAAQCLIPYQQTALKIFAKNPSAHKLWSSDKPLNPVQSEAIRSAIKHPFFLIQGPPGTGKSETGAHLAYVFAMTNREKHIHKCVLYCGPSNKAVDVVLGKFHKLVQRFPALKLRILRIYGKAIEKKDFVGPDGSISDEGSEYKPPGYSEAYALHKLIRKSSKGHDIAELEKQFKALGDNKCIAGIALREKFNDCLRSAKQEVLQQPYDIVLCTCNESCGHQVEMYIKPVQCIVDECAMAQEPETLAPISLCEHVVLIGDHKQLTPIINYLPAKACGLGTSLFQRYAELENYQDICITLTIQYRMHTAIQRFPSKHFYYNKLKPAEIVHTRKQIVLYNFWPVQKRPVVFCDIVGSEDQNKAFCKKQIKVALESKSNHNEAHKVVQIASRIHSIASNSTIAILTPYSAQKETIIEEATRVKLLTGKEVRDRLKVATITESQGDEFDFVILSLVRSQPLQDIKNPEHVWADRGWILQNLGFVTDQHQINVGITRSKFGLVIVGNKQLLKYDGTWRSLLADYEALGCVVDGESFPPQ